MRKLVQFELWKNCNNCCEFCFNKGFLRNNDDDKKHKIQSILSFLDSDEIVDYNAVGLIGGEIFDKNLYSEEILEYIHILSDKLAKMLETQQIKQVWFATGLMFDSFSTIKSVLDKFDSHGLTKNVLICTSYDTRGRFTGNKEEVWEKNIELLHKHYPEMPIHVETIVTQDFIDKVLNKAFDVDKFCKELDIHMDFLEPNCGFHYPNKYEHLKALPWFYPTRESFLKFLQECYRSSSIINKDFLSSHTRSYTLYMDDGKGYSKFTNRAKKDTSLPCDIDNQNGYADSEIEMRKDVELFLEMIDNE